MTGTMRWVRYAIVFCFTATVLALVQLALMTSVFACGSVVRVTFVEDSPDHFLIEFLEGHDVELKAATIDLSTSVGSAYVDTLYGASRNGGEDMAIPSEIRGFAERADKGTVLFKFFAPRQSFRLLVDLDDRSTGGDGNPNTLGANEIESAQVVVQLLEQDGKARDLSGAFNANGVANLGNRACT